MLAAVGDRMAGVPGVAARLFDALARARVNIRAIAQGASERNISVAIDSDDATKALRAAHAAFYLSPQTISVGVIGPGKVGAALLDQIAAARAAPEARGESRPAPARARVEPAHVRSTTRHRRRDWRERIARRTATPATSTASPTHVHTAHLPHAVIVDCSASDAVAAHYAGWLAAGIHIVTPNKQAGAGPLERYRAIRARRGERRVAFPLRSDGRRRPAGHPDAARPARHRRRDPRDRRHFFRHAGLAVQSLRRQRAVLRHSCARRTRSATPNRIRATIFPAPTSRASS